MHDDFSYDPVTAVDEATATGETAEIFADIRTTMEIPLVTSIWRGLAGMDNSLAGAWELAKPLYASGLPQHGLARVLNNIDLPVPEPLAPTQLACTGLTMRDRKDIHAVISAYNRSNGLNLIALAAMVAAPGDASLGTCSSPPPPPPQWSKLPSLLPRADIDDETWSMVRHVNAFGSSGADAAVATMWRHLARWPQLLALVHAGFAPMQATGTIANATARMVALAAQEGRTMAHLCAPLNTLPRSAQHTITNYVGAPNQVARMVTLGHALKTWLDN